MSPEVLKDLGIDGIPLTEDADGPIVWFDEGIQTLHHQD